jgi:uncharacterized membrane protein
MLGPVSRGPLGGFFKLNFILFLVCVSWVIIIFITPTLEPTDTIHFGDKGYTGLDEHYKEIESLQNPFNRIVYHSGDRMCHMKESRSFIIGDNQMPYCARCFGIFFGLALGAAITTFIVIDLKWWLLLLGIIPIGLDGGLQLITSYESNNVLRIFTGTLFGLVTMLAVGLVMVEISASTKQWMLNKSWFNKYIKKHNKEVKINSKKSKSE